MRRKTLSSLLLPVGVFRTFAEEVCSPMGGGEAAFALNNFLGFLGVDNHAQRLAVGEIVPHPVEQNDNFVAHAEDGAQMHNKPHEPGHEASHVYFLELGNGFVSANSCHRSEITIAEGLHFLAFLKALQILGQQNALLNGHLCQLRMSARPVGVALRHDALVANGEHAVESFNLVASVNLDSGATAEVRGIEVAHFLRGNTADPNEGARGYRTAVFQDDAVVLLVGHHLVEQHVDTHGAQIFLNVC